MITGDPARLVRRLALATTTLATGCWGLQTLDSDSLSFNAAYIHPGDDGRSQLTLFPTMGPGITVPLPPGLSSSLTVNAFSPDGDAIYLQDSAPGGLDGIRKIEFKPTRQSMVRGTAGIGTIWHLTVSQPSGSMFVSGLASTLRGAECGTFKIEQDIERPRKLLAGAFPECGGGGGEVSPDGTQVLGYAGGDLCLIDLASGAVQAIKGLKGISRDNVSWKGQVTWSPDGRWIVAALDHRRIILVDAKSPSKRKSLGSSGSGRAVWSRDSKHLLLLASQVRCAPSLGYFVSLEILNVETGERTVIKSSQCKVSGGWIGWIDPAAIR